MRKTWIVTHKFGNTFEVSGEFSRGAFDTAGEACEIARASTLHTAGIATVESATVSEWGCFANRKLEWTFKNGQ
jgi:hypothetical protein